MLHWLASDQLAQVWLANKSRLEGRLARLKPALIRHLGVNAPWRDLPLPARVYLICVWSMSGALVGWGVYRFDPSNPPIGMILFLILLMFSMDLFVLKLRPGEGSISIGVSGLVAAMMVLPPPSIPLAVCVSKSLAELRWEHAWYQKAFNVSQRVITGTTVAWTLQHFMNGPLRLGLLRDIAVVAGVWVGQYAISASLVVLAIALAMRLSPSVVWRTNFRDVLYHELLTAPLGTLMALLIQQHPLSVTLVLPPLFFMHHAIKLTSELRWQTTNALMAFADSVDKRDPTTYYHSLRVAELARDIAKRMGLPPHEVETIYLSARVHDLGKVGIGDAVLLKPGRLSDEEYEAIKEHPIIGAKIVGNFPLFGVGLDIVRHHHERFDGTGYPDQIAGNNIPLGARIIAVADTYDAMTADRPYRKGMPRDEVIQIIMEERGKQLDAKVVDAFLEVIGAASWTSVRAARNSRHPAIQRSSREEVSAPACLIL